MKFTDIEFIMQDAKYHPQTIEAKKKVDELIVSINKQIQLFIEQNIDSFTENELWIMVGRAVAFTHTSFYQSLRSHYYESCKKISAHFGDETKGGVD